MAYAVWYSLNNELGSSFTAQAASLGAALILAALVFLGLAWLTKLPELDLLKDLRRRRA